MKKLVFISLILIGVALFSVAQTANNSVIPLREGSWRQDFITSDNSDDGITYSFEVTRGKTYYIWWSDKRNPDEFVSYDDRLERFMMIFFVNEGWFEYEDYITITARSNGTMLLTALPMYSDETGSFAIAYNSFDKRPAHPYEQRATLSSPINQSNNTSQSSQTLDIEINNWIDLTIHHLYIRSRSVNNNEWSEDILRWREDVLREQLEMIRPEGNIRLTLEGAWAQPNIYYDIMALDSRLQKYVKVHTPISNKDIRYFTPSDEDADFDWGEGFKRPY